jgi:hypothetical protein
MMNERIRDMGIQAGLYVDLNGTPWPRAMSAEESEAAYKKFAELIVRECINQCAHAPDVSEDWYQGVKWVANEIAQHFGVEL